MKSQRTFNIAMIGSKGLPAVFGGIERHVEEVGRRLVEKGHRVTVFGRRPFSESGEYMGMRVKVLPSIPTKNLDAATSSLISTVKALFDPFDIVHYHGIGPSLFCWIPTLMGKITVSTIHAPDYRQVKWGPVAKYFLRMGERIAVRRSTAPVSVSKLMAERLGEESRKEVRYIPNGATLFGATEFAHAGRLGLEKERYILAVGRFIYERGFHTLLEAFRDVKTDLRMVIVGDARFEEEYAARLRDLADERVLFPGYISGPELNELYAHCSFYVLPSLVEGLPISLIEAMSFSRPLLVSDIPENLEVAEGIAVSFKRDDKGSLRDAMIRMLEMSTEERRQRGSDARKRVTCFYTWDIVAEQLDELYHELVA